VHLIDLDAEIHLEVGEFVDFLLNGTNQCLEVVAEIVR